MKKTLYYEEIIIVIETIPFKGMAVYWSTSAPGLFKCVHTLSLKWVGMGRRDGIGVERLHTIGYSKFRVLPSKLDNKANV